MDEPEDRFAPLYDEYVGTVYGFFGFRLGCRERAEDLTQETFRRALGAWDGFDESRAAPTTWLLTIARSLLLEHPVAGDRDGAGLGSDSELETALGRLSDRDREVLALRFGADLTGADIAAMTGLGLPEIQQITSESLRNLRMELDAPARQ